MMAKNVMGSLSLNLLALGLKLFYSYHVTNQISNVLIGSLNDPIVKRILVSTCGLSRRRGRKAQSQASYCCDNIDACENGKWGKDMVHYNNDCRVKQYTANSNT